MNYHDSVYGQTRIEDSVLIALMNTQAIKRLVHVLQHGITGFLGITHPFTRFEHSVGTMLLARQLNASLPEQIAALLHDVSHTAFSHVIDHVFTTPTGESFHEVSKQAYLQVSDIPQTLAAYGYDWPDFLDDSRYSILEQPAPGLCADRLDYFFRDSLALGLITPREVSTLVSHLLVRDGQIVVDELAAAQQIAYTYLEADEKSWSNLQAIGLYELMAQVIRRGLEVKAIREVDVWLTDQQVWEKLTAFNDAVLQHYLHQLATQIQFEENPANPHFRVTPKIRTVDPKVLIHDELVCLSTIDASYRQTRKAYLERKQRSLVLRPMG